MLQFRVPGHSYTYRLSCPSQRSQIIIEKNKLYNWQVWVAEMMNVLFRPEKFSTAAQALRETERD